jgi:signal transduction histidine kinase
VFKNLPTSLKLIILCSTFLVAISVTIYSLVAEKQIAIDFARKELVGNRYLTTLREVYGAILTTRMNGQQAIGSADEIIKALSAAGADADGILQTGEARQALTATLRDLWGGEVKGGNADALVLDALAKGRALASRVGDDSNLALDPDLDSYYLQGIVVTRLPTFLGQLGEMRALLHRAAATGADANERKVRVLVLDGLLRSTIDGMKHDLGAAHRGNSDGTLAQSVDAAFATLISNAETYLGALRASTSGLAAEVGDGTSLDTSLAATVADALKAWAAAQDALDRLLRRRIDGLLGKMAFSLGLTGMLAAFSILIAVMTHWHIVRPLERLEHTASTVRETRNYNLRIDYGSRDEIGRLAIAFNDMLAEIAAAREREMSKQAELARIAQLTTMGEMAASIAHEINQPLAAIVTSGNAGLRWLNRTTPELDETRASLQRIVRDGQRASQVIASVRALFKKDTQARTPVDVDDLLREALALVDGELQNQKIVLRTRFAGGLPPVLAERIQLQQVILNLLSNAIDAMRPVTNRVRLLRVESAVHDSDGILITVEDSGTGIDPEDIDRIFDPFFTTKSNGMGLGLSICRSFIEAHGGRLWASAATPHGSIFHVALPRHSPGGES